LAELSFSPDRQTTGLFLEDLSLVLQLSLDQGCLTLKALANECSQFRLDNLKHASKWARWVLSQVRHRHLYGQRIKELYWHVRRRVGWDGVRRRVDKRTVREIITNSGCGYTY
jgi:hypothetical protein